MTNSGNSPPVMIAKAYESLREEYIIPLLDYMKQEATRKKATTADKNRTQGKLYAMVGKMVFLKRAIDDPGACFTVDQGKSGKPGAGERDDNEDQSSYTPEVNAKLAEIFGIQFEADQSA